MSRTRIGAALALLALALLALPGGSSGDSASPTWAGTWNTDFGVMKLGAGGSGTYEGFTKGTISGPADGRVNEGTWHQEGDPPKNGTYKFTMSGDGLSFSGEWHYDTGGCGSTCGWNGVCAEGACLKNDDPPKANKCGGAGTNAFAAAACPPVKTVPAPATFDTTVTTKAPAPGDAAVNKSPVLGDAKKVTATVKGLSAEDAVVLANLKSVCYANFVKASTPGRAVIGRSFYDELDVPKALSDLAFCLAFAEALVIEAVNSSTNASDPSATGARARCRGAGVKYALEGSGRNTKIKSLRFTSGKLRVGCERVRHGLKIKYRTKTGRPLRRVVGKRLPLLVMRSEKDPRGGQLSFRYHKG